MHKLFSNSMLTICVFCFIADSVESVSFVTQNFLGSSLPSQNRSSLPSQNRVAGANLTHLSSRVFTSGVSKNERQIGMIHRSKLDSDPFPQGIVLSSWFTTKVDPQRGVQMPKSPRYIWNFWLTCNSHQIHTQLFHDGLSKKVISVLSTPYFSLSQKITLDKQYSTNDFRFLVYKKWLDANMVKRGIKYVIFADARDVFFRMNPFDYIHRMYNKNGLQAFPGKDFTMPACQNDWFQGLMSSCYKINPVDLCKEHAYPFLNAGAWGIVVDSGNAYPYNILRCMVHEFNVLNGTGGNCNMGVYNYCFNQYRMNITKMGRGKDIDVSYNIINKYTLDCAKENNIIVHDKCGDNYNSCFTPIIPSNNSTYVIEKHDLKFETSVSQDSVQLEYHKNCPCKFVWSEINQDSFTHTYLPVVQRFSSLGDRITESDFKISLNYFFLGGSAGKTATVSFVE